MYVINRNDMIGRRLMSILAVGKVDDEGMDFCDCVMVLDSGLAFRLPAFPDEPFRPEEPLAGATPIVHPRMRDVLGATVVAMLRPRSDDDLWPGSVALGLSTGTWLTHVTAAPHGVGGVGIFFADEATMDHSWYVDFWDRTEYPLKLVEFPLTAATLESRLRMVEANYGRDGRLTEPTFAERFWVRYRLEPTSQAEDVTKALFEDIHWCSPKYAFRSRQFPQHCVDAFGPVDPDHRHVALQGLYLNPPFTWQERVRCCWRLWSARRTMERERRLDIEPRS